MLTILCLIVILAAFCTTAQAQVITIGDHHGFVDATTKHILISTAPDDPTSADIPATYTLGSTIYQIQTTTLPLVRLQHGAMSSETFSRGCLTLIDPSPADPANALTDYPVELRYRGATALNYTKKNYAVKLIDSTASDGDDNSLDASILGMRSDNSWILDAMACDVARMRNRVSTDIWLDFSTRPYYARQAGEDQPAIEPDMTNGTHGRFVEVFVGERYWGIYCLTEKVDRKQLKLRKFKDDHPRGILYKSFTFDNMHVITDPTPDNTSQKWQGWECSYPDVRKGEPIDWNPLYQLVDFLCLPIPDFDLIDHLYEHIDIPLWIDYNIFCDLLHADDNVCKNIFAYYRDITQPASLEADTLARPLRPRGSTVTVPAPGPLCVCPWDLDATWGRDYKFELVDPTSNCNVSNAANYHIWLSQRDNGQAYYSRWAKLRQHEFTTDSLWPYFQRYFDLFASSGAADREVERWQDVDGVHLDFANEATYIHDWIHKRIAYLDGDYDYIDTGIITPTPDASTTLLPVYALSGRLVGHCTSTADVDALQLPAGIYIVGHQKIVVQ